MVSKWLVFDGWRVGIWNVAIGGDRGWWMSWLMEMEEMEEVFCGVGMVDVGFPRRKIWSLVLGDWKKGRGRWRPRGVGSLVFGRRGPVLVAIFCALVFGLLLWPLR